jgi:hypothetical protein
LKNRSIEYIIADLIVAGRAPVISVKIKRPTLTTSHLGFGGIFASEQSIKKSAAIKPA